MNSVQSVKSLKIHGENKIYKKIIPTLTTPPHSTYPSPLSEDKIRKPGKDFLCKLVAKRGKIPLNVP
jgi:hypothetical protein